MFAEYLSTHHVRQCFYGKLCLVPQLGTWTTSLSTEVLLGDETSLRSQSRAVYLPFSFPKGIIQFVIFLIHSC